MQVVLAISVLIGLALLSVTLSRRALRSRVVTLAISGLWGACLIGFFLGPDVSGVINQGTRAAPGTRELAMPLVMVMLGWVGMMLGLQARPDVISRVPPAVWRIVRADVLITCLLWGPILGGLVLTCSPGIRGDARIAAIIAFVAAMLGWSSETRSLRPAGLDAPPPGEVAIRASGAILSMIAVGVFGLGVFAVIGVRRSILEPSSVGLALAGTAIGMALTVIAGSMIGRLGLSLAERSRGSQLVVFLGTLSLVAGIAAKVGASSLLCAGIVGVMIGSTRGFGAREFERFLLGAEIAIATLLGLLVGIGAEAPIRTPDLALSALIVAWRIVVKPRTISSGRGGDPIDASARISTIRAHPIALAIGLGLTLHVDDATASRVAGILVVSAIATDLASLALTRIRDRAARAPIATPATHGSTSP